MTVEILEAMDRVCGLIAATAFARSERRATLLAEAVSACYAALALPDLDDRAEAWFEGKIAEFEAVLARGAMA